MIEGGTLEALYLRPLDLSPDETLHEIREAVKRVGARRVVIDSMSGFELALAPTFRADFRESLYRLVGALTGVGITVLTTMEVTQGEDELRFTPNVISFLADDLISLRYVEVERRLKKVVAVVKMRGSQHSKAFREYDITEHGFEATAYTLRTDQFGTQLDPPSHWNPLGATISDLPATYAVRPLVVIDISGSMAVAGNMERARQVVCRQRDGSLKSGAEQRNSAPTG